jgi:hypothetical protein
MRKWLLLLTLAIGASVAASAQTGDIETTDLQILTPEQLGQILTGPGATISNVKFTGDPRAAGTFTGGIAAGFPIESGVILSSGDIANIRGPNDTESKSTSFNTPGDPQLDALIGGTTHDAAVLEFDVVTTSPDLVIRYVFASEEYKEFVGSAFNDVFGFFVNGQNIAFVQGDPNQTVSINSINHLENSHLYIDNPPGSGGANTQFDGFTVLLTATATLAPGVPHHLKLAIADTTDTILDSAVILQTGGITGGPIVQVRIAPRSVQASAGEVIELDVTAFGLPPGDEMHLEPSLVPRNWDVVIEPNVLVGPPFPEDGSERPRPTAGMVVRPAADAFPRSYGIEIRGSGESTVDDEGNKLPFETFAGTRVDIICDPPVILGRPSHQPETQTVAAGERVTLEVVASGGTQPFSYQWYVGPSGSTKFPISGATAASYQTPEIHRVLQYWVRVSNGCGDRDSWTATITPEGQSSPKQSPDRSRPTRRRGGS